LNGSNPDKTELNSQIHRYSGKLAVCKVFVPGLLTDVDNIQYSVACDQFRAPAISREDKDTDSVKVTI
jgi:hypothetical protein